MDLLNLDLVALGDLLARGKVSSRDVIAAHLDRLESVEPARETALSFERAGLLLEILYEEGDRIEAGAVIARLDIEPLLAERDVLLAERRQLDAELELARLTEDRQKTLHEEGHASAQRYDEARLAAQALIAAVARVDAGIRALDIDIAKSDIIAPFGGRVAERFVDEGRAMAAGAPVVHVLETDRLQVRVGLSPDAAAALNPGDPVTITHDGQALEAHVVALCPDLSTATRTVPVIVSVADGGRLLVGSLVELAVPRWIATPGTWLPLTALAEGPKGLWTVYTVGDAEGGHVALQEAVEVLHVAGDRAFVRGTLAPDAMVISGGHHRIVPDQRVALTGG